MHFIILFRGWKYRSFYFYFIQCTALPFFEVIRAMVLGSSPVYFGVATAHCFSTHLIQQRRHYYIIFHCKQHPFRPIL